MDCGSRRTFAVCFIEYDGDHILTTRHILNILTIIAIIIVSHIAAEYIININRVQREKVLKAIQEREQYLSEMMMDSLSGVYSRVALKMHEEDLYNYSGKACVAMLDIDNFKRVNDTYGHPYGDEVIKILGSVLREHFGDAFMAFRCGGEEFLCIIKTDEETAKVLLNYIKNKFGSICMQELENPDISFSAGIRELFEKASISEAIKDADEALYEAKRTGKNKVLVFE